MNLCLICNTLIMYVINNYFSMENIFESKSLSEENKNKIIK